MGSGGAVLMDLLKAFDTINYDLLLVKLHACGCTNESLLFRSQLLFSIYLNDLFYLTKCTNVCG